MKTRLMPALGAQRATALHRWMVAGTCDAAKAAVTRRGISLLIRYTGGTEDAMAAWLGDDLQYEDQGEGDLGHRLRRAFDVALGNGHRGVVVIGTDCPELTGAEIEDAFERLGDSELVLGPAADGGYYLIGMSRAFPRLFDAIPWGTDRVLAETRQVAEELRLSVSMLRLLHDVDRPEDLESVRALPEEWRTMETERD